MAQTVIEKIVERHLVKGPNRPVRANDFVSLRPKHVMTHDNTSAVIAKFNTLCAKAIFDPSQPVFALDHDIQNVDEQNLRKYSTIEAFARKHGIHFYPTGTGIGHQIMVEQGYILPGSLVVASDSHSNIYGALGALGTPVVRSDAAGIWATGEFWWQVPRTVRVVLEGQLAPGVSGKDVILALCGVYSHQEVLNAAIEFAGSGIFSLSIDTRLAIANMTTEWGALAALFPADSKSFDYLRKRAKMIPSGHKDRLNDDILTDLELHTPVSDTDAIYAAEIMVDLAQLTPHVSGPDNPQTTRTVSEVTDKKIAIQKAYLVSCVNSRLEDLEAAAAVLKGRAISPNVKFYLAAASAEIQSLAEKNGAWATIVGAGAQPLPPACGPCIGLGTGLLEPGEVGISATNRNFKGRMGSRDAVCYLASPAVVAASALAGYITAPSEWQRTSLERKYVEFAQKDCPSEEIEIVAGFPPELRGRLVVCPMDAINTDAIYSRKYTYRDDVTRETMASVVMENYDPQFARSAKTGDIVAGGFNFGTGSSREQAVTALQAKGVRLVIAGSFSQVFQRNAFNNGFLCVACPELIAVLQQKFRAEIALGQHTIIPGEDITVDFKKSLITYCGATFSFSPIGIVPQSLVVAGGIVNMIAQQLATPAADLHSK